jgi:hypothetical protein
MSVFPSFLENQQSSVPSTPSQSQPGRELGQGLGNSFNRHYERQLDLRLQQAREQQQQRPQNVMMAGDGLGGQPGQMNMQGQQAGMYPTAPGYQIDLHNLWLQVQELSGLLEQNRESTQGIVRRVGEIRVSRS